MIFAWETINGFLKLVDVNVNHHLHCLIQNKLITGIQGISLSFDILTFIQEVVVLKFCMGSWKKTKLWDSSPKKRSKSLKVSMAKDNPTPISNRVFNDINLSENFNVVKAPCLSEYLNHQPLPSPSKVFISLKQAF